MAPPWVFSVAYWLMHRPSALSDALWMDGSPMVMLLTPTVESTLLAVQIMVFWTASMA